MHLIVIPHDLAAELHEPLRRHYRDNPSVRVVVERRPEPDAAAKPRSRGRRAGDRRRRARPRLVPASWPGTPPPEALPHLGRLRYMVEIESESAELADVESLRLVSAFQQGDEDAFEELYRRHFAGVYDFLRVALPDADLAEDLTQEVFMTAHEKLGDYRVRPHVPLFAWLKAIARNLAISRLRRTDAELRDPHELADAAAEAEASAGVGERSLIAMVERLPSTDQQRAFMLRDVFGLTVAETAAAMGKTPDSIVQLTRRARQRLRREATEAGATRPSAVLDAADRSRSARFKR